MPDIEMKEELLEIIESRIEKARATNTSIAQEIVAKKDELKKLQQDIEKLRPEKARLEKASFEAKQSHLAEFMKLDDDMRILVERRLAAQVSERSQREKLREVNRLIVAAEERLREREEALRKAEKPEKSDTP